MGKLENLIPFKKGQSGNPKGRPKKLVPTMKVEGYKLTEINDTIQSLISMTMEELKEVWTSPNSTILEKSVAGALRKSLEKGNLESMETLLNRVYGKPKEKIDMTTQGENSIKIEIVQTKKIDEDRTDT